MTSRGARALTLSVCSLAVGCTTVLGIDKDYEPISDTTTGSGGGAGATTSTGAGGGTSTGTGGVGGGGGLKADGVPCAADGECQSGFCTDDVCCDAKCGGFCAACAAALSVGTDGVCTPIPPYQDPESECTTAGTTCDGAGNCRKEDGQPCSNPGQCVSDKCEGNVCVP